jgi:hypothetical protein
MRSVLMILLQAIRLDVYGRFQYRIDASDREVVVTNEAEKAIELLRALGVHNPVGMIDHVQMWGSIDLPDPRSKPSN